MDGKKLNLKKGKCTIPKTYTLLFVKSIHGNDVACCFRRKLKNRVCMRVLCWKTMYMHIFLRSSLMLPKKFAKKSCDTVPHTANGDGGGGVNSPCCAMPPQWHKWLVPRLATMFLSDTHSSNQQFLLHPMLLKEVKKEMQC